MVTSSGFDGDGFGGERLFGLYMGTVIDRVDPDGDGRVRVRIPGLMEQSPWARPRGGGHTKWGKNDVPPMDCDVYVQFVNGDPRLPVYEPADHGLRRVDKGNEKVDEPERFPEFEDPDVHVWGRGPFRLVVDNREGQRSAVLKVVRVIGADENGNGGEETDVAWLYFNYEDNSVELHADSAIGVSGTIFDVDCPGVVLNGRKLTANGKAIN